MPPEPVRRKIGENDPEQIFHMKLADKSIFETETAELFDWLYELPAWAHLRPGRRRQGCDHLQGQLPAREAERLNGKLAETPMIED